MKAPEPMKNLWALWPAPSRRTFVHSLTLPTGLFAPI